jgi:uncharacterized protein
MSATGPAVLLMARAPRPGQVRRGVIELLGERGAAALQAELIREVARWAHAVAPGRVFVAHDPADDPDELRPLVGEAGMFPQSGEGVSRRLVDAAMRVFGRGGAPLLAVWPELAVMREASATAALEDLQTGCDVVLGPLIDGGLYLIGLARPLEALFATAETQWRSADVMQLGFAAAQEAGVELGLLRTERGLRRPGDVRAALADPCLPARIGRVLGAAR